ncbi:MAG: class I SAM-dependent methyltransferase [Bryobacteraceae bacterium]|jgi:caffeoyl-CoA O-methyltransferase
MSRTYTPMTERLAEYVRTVTLREPEALRRLREETENHPQASCQIAPEQGQFLHLLVRLMGARKALEVGVFMGYSSTWVALALPMDGKLVACDVSEEFTARARKTWRAAGVESRIDLRLAPALATLDALIAGGDAGTFDFAFIDADKPNYSNYYERALALLRPGGLIAVDNVLWKGKVADPEQQDADTLTMRAFNRKLHQDHRVALAMATMGDGLTLACKLRGTDCASLP